MTVVTGGLGAGKSTLIQWLVDSLAQLRVAVVDNEPMAPKGSVRGARDADTTIVDDTVAYGPRSEPAALAGIMRSVLDLDPPVERVLVETTALDLLPPLIRALEDDSGLRRGLVPGGVVTVLDAGHPEQIDVLAPTRQQVQLADLVVLNRCDRAEPEEVARSLKRVRDLNPTARIETVTRGEVDLALVLELVDGARPMQSACSAKRPRSQATHAACDFLWVQAVVPNAVRPDLFFSWLEYLGEPGGLVRVKGELALPGVDRRVLVQVVRDVVEFYYGEPWEAAQRRGMLVLAGEGLEAEQVRAGLRSVAA